MAKFDQLYYNKVDPVIQHTGETEFSNAFERKALIYSEHLRRGIIVNPYATGVAIQKNSIYRLGTKSYRNRCYQGGWLYDHHLAPVPNQDPLLFTCSGGSRDMLISSYHPWQIISQPSWITISPLSYQTSNIFGSNIKISVGRNVLPDNTPNNYREGVIIINNGFNTIEISVSQLSCIDEPVEPGISANPTINEVTASDLTVSGTGVNGSTIRVYFPNGQSVSTVVSNGIWSVDAPVLLIAGEIISATQTESGKTVSNEVEVVIQDLPDVQLFSITGTISGIDTSLIGTGAHLAIYDADGNYLSDSLIIQEDGYFIFTNQYPVGTYQLALFIEGHYVNTWTGTGLTWDSTTLLATLNLTASLEYIDIQVMIGCACIKPVNDALELRLNGYEPTEFGICDCEMLSNINEELENRLEGMQLLILTINVPMAQLNIANTIPITFITEAGVIDWGDGTIETVAATVTPSHAYTAVGDYTVKFRHAEAGSINIWSTETTAVGWGNYVTSILQWPSKLYAIRCMGYRNLVSIPNTELPVTINNALSLRSVFSYCLKLKTIPEILFNLWINVIDITAGFNLCYALEKIPEKLLYNNTKNTSIGSLFQSAQVLTSISEDLFTNQTSVTVANNTLAYGIMTHIPAGLLRNTKIINLRAFSSNNTKLITSELQIPLTALYTSGMYRGCTSLKTVNIRLTNVTETYDVTNGYMFGGCTALTDVVVEGTIKASISFADSPLTHGSFENISNALVDLIGQTAQSIAFSEVTALLLSYADVQAITDKNWTVLLPIEIPVSGEDEVLDSDKAKFININ